MNAKIQSPTNDEITLVKRNGKTSIVTQEEFNKLNEGEKQLVVQIEASLASLEVYEQNGISNYFAIFIYKVNKKIFSDGNIR